MDQLAIAALLSVVITKFVDTVRNGIDTKDSAPKVTWNVVSFGLGILLAVVFSVDVFANFSEGNSDVVGKVFTGLVLGAWASGWHEFFDFLSARGHSGNPKSSG